MAYKAKCSLAHWLKQLFDKFDISKGIFRYLAGGLKPPLKANSNAAFGLKPIRRALKVERSFSIPG